MARSRHVPPPAQATPEDREKLWKRLADLRVAMLTTHDHDGSLNGRPVSTLRIDPEGTLWFFVARDGGIAGDLLRNPHVNVCFMDVGDDTYAWLRGRGRLVDDLEKVKELWTPMAGAWFPDGPEDRNLGLLEIDVDRGDYWDVTSSKLVQFFSLAAAAITRKPPEETGTHKQF